MNRLRALYSAGLARRLMGLGFVVKDIKPNPKNKDRTVFYFKNTVDLERIIDRYSNKT